MKAEYFNLYSPLIFTCNKGFSDTFCEIKRDKWVLYSQVTERRYMMS